MPTIKKNNLFDTEEGMEIVQILQNMEEDKSYNTQSSYSADVADYPDRLIPFIDKHIKYLSAHPEINPKHYIANLKLITRLR